MVFHVVSLPHTNTTSDFVVCAYTEKVRKFCNMMKRRGHTVYLYGGTVTDAECDELITCISEEDRLALVSDDYVTTPFDYQSDAWRLFNLHAIDAIRHRTVAHDDIVCLIAGLAQQQIADALPLMCVEFGIGYGGTFSQYRVFESYAWMHTVYAQGVPNVHEIDGNFFDAVIPNYFEPEKFPFSEEKDDYYLYMGRLVSRKGADIASQVCEKLGERLIIAGSGTPPQYGEHVGLVNEQERGLLMSRARALFVPTLYIEPFGGVAIEAMLCGTPVITTDWGAFTETNIHGLTGYRCRTFGEFIWAAKNVEHLDPWEIRHHAELHYSTERVAELYEDYFDRLQTLWNEGWYTETTGKTIEQFK